MLWLVGEDALWPSEFARPESVVEFSELLRPSETVLRLSGHLGTGGAVHLQGVGEGGTRSRGVGGRGSGSHSAGTPPLARSDCAHPDGGFSSPCLSISPSKPAH